MSRRRSVGDHYREVESRIRAEINGESDADIVGLDTDEYVSYLSGKYGLRPVERDQSREAVTDLARWKGNDHTAGFRPGREVMVATIEYPIVGHEKVEEVLSLVPSSYGSSLPEFDVRQDRLILKVPLPFLYHSTDSPPTGSSEMTRAISELEDWLGNLNRDIREQEAKLRSTIRKAVEGRKEHVVKTRAGFEAIVKQVSFPLRVRRLGRASVLDLRTRQELKPILVKPTPKRREEYNVQREDVVAVVEILKRWGRSLEATPKSVSENLSSWGHRSRMTSYDRIKRKKTVSK